MLLSSDTMTNVLLLSTTLQCQSREGCPIDSNGDHNADGRLLDRWLDDANPEVDGLIQLH